jgi:hypothetical protein
MAYNHDELFSAVDKMLSKSPMLPLYRISKELGCSHPIIEKAVLLRTALCFREYKKRKLIQLVIMCAKNGQTAKSMLPIVKKRIFLDTSRLDLLRNNFISTAE